MSGRAQARRMVTAKRRRARSAVLTLGILGVSAVSVQAQPAVEPPAAPEPAEEASQLPDIPEDPYEAFDAGHYDHALEGFVDQQVERPDDPCLSLNAGSAYYKMEDYEAAEREFKRALSRAPRGTKGRRSERRFSSLAGSKGCSGNLRAEALYNLGNTAYRRGDLEGAIEDYMASLEEDPDDEDAKYNLEFVREEMKRRQNEAEKQQEQQEQPQEEQQEQQQDQQQQNQQQQQQSSQDADGDGLPDEVETQGDNPTDPQNPDTDGDGLQDGQEDKNRNGRVDEGETDPNRADNDNQGQSESESASSEPPPEGMTPEEAARFLDSLEEHRPDEETPERRRRINRRQKDW